VTARRQAKTGRVEVYAFPPLPQEQRRGKDGAPCAIGAIGKTPG
jgi:hypothetical protein